MAVKGKEKASKHARLFNETLQHGLLCSIRHMQAKIFGEHRGGLIRRFKFRDLGFLAKAPLDELAIENGPPHALPWHFDNEIIDEKRVRMGGGVPASKLVIGLRHTLQRELTKPRPALAKIGFQKQPVLFLDKQLNRRGEEELRV